MKTLHLNLKKKWFDMILSGEKTEEYREIKDFWIQRLFECATDLEESILQQTLSHLEFFEFLNEDKKTEDYKILLQNNVKQHLKHFDTITFSNGSSKTRRQFEISFNRLEISYGKQKLGAEKNKRYFVLSLGKIISENCKVENH